MSATELTKAHVRALLPDRPREGHKGTFGHLYVIAGSRGFTGAAKMVGEAAARAGAGLVTVGVPKPLGDLVGASLTEVMTMLLPATEHETVAPHAVEAALAFAEGKDAVAIGPGLSQRSGAQSFVRAFVPKCVAPLVIDADGLNAIAGHPDIMDNIGRPYMITPHPGEMARLCDCSAKDVQADREGITHDFAVDHGCVVVLKGCRTVVADPGGDVFVNPTGNSGMGSGGTGDVLTGILGSLVAQGMTPLNAAQLGVYLHGLAGDLAAAEKTERALIARDVIDCLPEAWRILEGAFDA